MSSAQTARFRRLWTVLVARLLPFAHTFGHLVVHAAAMVGLSKLPSRIRL
jgi:hypothetical protein